MLRVFRGARPLAAAAKAPANAAAPGSRSAAEPKGTLKPLHISAAMRKFIGQPEISRAEAVKKVWDYIKVHQLQRWIFSKFVEVYYKRIVPMKKYGMVPNHSFFQAMTTCLLAILPDKFYEKVEEGSIVLKQSKNFVFCKEGIIVDGDLMPIKADLVIFCTGFKGDQKLSNIFKSPLFQNLMAGCLDSTVPLYRECIHPRIPQLAVIGYSESLANLYTSEMRARWLANLLGGFRLPSIENMEKDVLEWEKFMKRYSKEYYRRSSISTIHIWYNDQLCRDIGCNPKRKKGFFADLFLPYGPLDYVGVG